MTPDKFTHVPHSYDKDDLTSGKVDVMSAYLTDQPFYFRQRGIPLNIINPQNYGLDFYGDLLFTSAQEIQANPGRAELFLRASLKGWQYALDHPEDLIQLVKHQYQSPLSLEHLRFEAAETHKMIRPESIPLGRVNQTLVAAPAGIDVCRSQTGPSLVGAAVAEICIRQPDCHDADRGGACLAQGASGHPRRHRSRFCSLRMA